MNSAPESHGNDGDGVIATVRDSSRRLAELLRREHASLGDFLVALAEFDRERSFRRLGYAHLFDYLRRELGLSCGAAHDRKVAARLVRAYPEVVEPLRDGRLCLSAVGSLAKVITPENRGVVLPRFFRRSRREARAIAAAIQPATVVPRREVVTRLQAAGLPRAAATAEVATGIPGVATDVPGGEAKDVPGAATGSPDGAAAKAGATPTLTGAIAGATGHAGSLPGSPSGSQGFSLHMHADSPNESAATRSGDANRPSCPDGVGSCAASVRPVPGDTTEPLTAYLRRWHLTVSADFLAKFERARAGQSHVHPNATAEQILDAALDLLLAAQERRRASVPPRVKREVRRRDGGRCQWPTHDGGICGSTVRTEVDHVIPRGRGGPSTVDNCRILCDLHNREAARIAYGDDLIDRFAPRVPVARDVAGVTGATGLPADCPDPPVGDSARAGRRHALPFLRAFFLSAGAPPSRTRSRS